jgi:hypothetical protein
MSAVARLRLRVAGSLKKVCLTAFEPLAVSLKRRPSPGFCVVAHPNRKGLQPLLETLRIEIVCKTVLPFGFPRCQADPTPEQAKPMMLRNNDRPAREWNKHSTQSSYRCHSQQAFYALTMNESVFILRS